MMSMRIFFVLAITATAFRQGAPFSPITRQSLVLVSPECKKEVKSIQTKEKAAAVGACEGKANYPKQAIAHLQNGERSAAIATIEESFQKCAKFSKSCAKELAPRVIQQLEFSGAAISNTCKQTVAKIQNDEQKMQEVAKCEQGEQVVKNMVTALTKNELKTAVDAAEKGLEKCMGLEHDCASQVAPVIVNQLFMRLEKLKNKQSAQKAIPTTTVLASLSTTVIGLNTDKLSLIDMALDQRTPTALAGTHGLSFLQQAGASERFVSRMLMQLAN